MFYSSHKPIMSHWSRYRPFHRSQFPPSPTKHSSNAILKNDTKQNQKKKTNRFHAKEPLKDGGRYKMTLDNDQKLYHMAKLEITQVVTGDRGEYKALARNKHGEGVATINLNFEGSGKPKWAIPTTSNKDNIDTLHPWNIWPLNIPSQYIDIRSYTLLIYPLNFSFFLVVFPLRISQNPLPPLDNHFQSYLQNHYPHIIGIHRFMRKPIPIFIHPSVRLGVPKLWTKKNTHNAQNSWRQIAALPQKTDHSPGRRSSDHGVRTRSSSGAGHHLVSGRHTVQGHTTAEDVPRGNGQGHLCSDAGDPRSAHRGWRKLSVQRVQRVRRKQREYRAELPRYRLKEKVKFENLLYAYAFY